MVCAQLVEFASAMAKCSESISCIAMASYQLSLYVWYSFTSANKQMVPQY